MAYMLSVSLVSLVVIELLVALTAYLVHRPVRLVLTGLIVVRPAAV